MVLSERDRDRDARQVAPSQPPERYVQGCAGRVAHDARRHLNPPILWEPDPCPIPWKSTPAAAQVPIIIRFPYPLLSNLVLDELDRELTRRGHRFCRYADDCNIYVRSQRAGERVMASVARFLTTTLRLKVNESKSAVARPEERKFLGFSIANDGSERRIAPQTLAEFKARIRDLTSRTRGISLHRMIETLKPYLLGWRGYFGRAGPRGLDRDRDLISGIF